MKKPATILGLAIGDALGQPFEFFSAEDIIKTNWQGNFLPGARGYQDQFKLDAGQWTDDTKMALCIAESLIESNGFDVDNLAAKYVGWIKSGDLRGIGGKTKASLNNIARGVPPLEAAKKGAGQAKPAFKRISEPKKEEFCGCGTVMRCAPIGAFFGEDWDQRVEVAKLDASITHDHPDARDASIYLCNMIAYLNEPQTPFVAELMAVSYDFESLNIPKLCSQAVNLATDKDSTYIDAIALGVGGMAHEVMATAMYCFLRYESFKEAVTSAVLMGGDTDSRAAVVGAMAGTHYGLEGIPTEWVEQVEDSQRLQEIDNKLWKHNGKER